MKKLFKFFMKLWTAIGIVILIPIILILAICVVLATGYSIVEVIWWGIVFTIIFSIPLAFIRSAELKGAKKRLKKAENKLKESVKD